MDEARIAFSLDDRTIDSSAPTEASSGVGKVQSFVELPELRRILSRLATTELLRMIAVETFG